MQKKDRGVDFLKCPNCQTNNPAGSKFCQGCGQELKQPETTPQRKCPICGAQNDANNVYCESCGQPMQRSVGKATQNNGPYTPAAKKSNTLGIILGILAGIVVLAIGGFYIFQHSGQSSSDDSTVASSSSSSSKASSQAKSSSSKTSASTKTSSFDEAKIKKLVDSNMANVSGDKTVYVSPVNEDKSYLLNNQTQSAASVIKLFILAAAYAQQKIGTIDLSDTYTLKDSDKVGGTGVIQNMDAGQTFTYRELLTYMIDESDNTAANIMIEALGGLDKVNSQIQKMGAKDTKLQRMLMDTASLKAGKDNITSAADVGELLKKIYNHKFISKSDSQEILAILEKNQDHDYLVKNIPSEATIYNKTGIMQNYGVLNDAAIIKNSKGAFVAVVMTQNGENSEEQVAMNSLGLALYNEILK